MIVLKNIYLEKSTDEVFLKADCTINGKPEILWYSTDIEKSKYISTSNADAFLLVLFVYSVFNNFKLVSEVPISSELKYGLLEVLLPSFKDMGFNSKKEDFQFLYEDETVFPEAYATGTAMSFGIDSFYTYLSSEKSVKEVDTFTLFNAGAFGQYGGSEANVLFDKMKEKLEVFSAKQNKKFVWINTNLNGILKMPFVQTHTFRNFACVLVMQKYFKNYLYASGSSIKNFKLIRDDTLFYDLLISKAINGNSLNFHISGLNQDRVQKTKFLAEKPLVMKYLNVCLITPDNKAIGAENLKNCSKCFKCTRTMITLDVLGKLESFGNVFDLNMYKKNKEKYLADILYSKYRSRDVFAVEVFDYIKKYNFKYSLKVYWYLLKKPFSALMRKI